MSAPRGSLAAVLGVALFAPAGRPACDEDAQEKAKNVPVIARIDDVELPRSPRLPGFVRVEPRVFRAAEDLPEVFGDGPAEAISGRIDWERQLLVFFQWAGSGQDRLAHAVEAENDKRAIVFTFTPGRTRDLRPHAQLYALRKDVPWKVAR